MNTQWKVKNIIITNTGKYNKKAGREEEKKKKKEEKEKPQEDHCIQWSTYSLWVCSTLIYLNLARLTRFTAIALQSLFKTSILQSSWFQQDLSCAEGMALLKQCHKMGDCVHVLWASQEMLTPTHIPGPETTCFLHLDHHSVLPDQVLSARKPVQQPRS